MVSNYIKTHINRYKITYKFFSAQIIKAFISKDIRK